MKYKAGDYVKIIEMEGEPSLVGKIGCIKQIDGSSIPYKVKVGRDVWWFREDEIKPAKLKPKLEDFKPGTAKKIEKATHQKQQISQAIEFLDKVKELLVSLHK